MAYPPQMLHAHSWRAMMGDLPRHFGSDASLDEKRRVAITDFLVSQRQRAQDRHHPRCRRQAACCASPKPPLQKKHREVAAATFQRASIKSPANCTACHVNARRQPGDYSERSINIPK
jgi:hypothetical protein